MDRRFKVVVVPHNIDLNKASSYEESIFGAAFSNVRQLQVNEVEDGYSILYKDKDFVKLNMKSIARQIIAMIDRNFAKEELEINLFYFHNDNLWEKCGEHICQLDTIFDEYADDVDGNITYERTDLIEDIYEKLGYEDDDEEEEDDDELDDVCSSGDVVDTLRKMTGYRGSAYHEDDDDNDDYPRRVKSDKKRYQTSNVLRTTKNAKKMIRRHNVIISSDKRARKRDKKIIREMAKDFIKPGKSRLMRDFTEDVARRWFNEFVISKKMAKRLTKAHRREQQDNTKSTNGTKDKALSLTRTILKSVDPFYDPNQ